YAYSILATFFGLVRAYRRNPFAAIQVCNPPDVLFVAALPFLLRGVKLVFDQHDLCPELYESRFGTRAALPYRALLLAERMTYRLSSRVIATNDSYKRVAVTRGRKKPSDVTVVRTGPDPDRMRRGEAQPGLRRSFAHLLAYLGVMGPQDGVDLALRAMAHIVHDRGRTDIGLTLVGDGDAGPELRALAKE